jgi:hypothetical protein
LDGRDEETEDSLRDTADIPILHPAVVLAARRRVPREGIHYRRACKAQNDLHTAEDEYERLPVKVEAASERLRERDGDTTAIARFLDGFLEEHHLKEELREIEK